MKNIKRIISVLAALTVCATACGCSKEKSAVVKLTPDYKSGTAVSKDGGITCSNGDLTLNIDRENLNIIVTENSTGRMWASNPAPDFKDNYASGINKTNLFSQLVVTYIGDANKIETTNSYISSYKKGTYKVFAIENGFRVEYTFKENFTIPVEYVLLNGNFIASILYTGITESANNKICSIELLPFFGTADGGDNGFMLVPDGSGAIIDFNNGKNGCSVYEAKVYGIDESLPNDITTSRTQQIHIPLIGMKKNDGAYIALATSGAAESTVNASVSGLDTAFNRIYFKAIYRESAYLSVINGSLGTAGLVMYTAQEPTTEKRFTVQYTFIGGENPTFGDMVSEARERILSDKTISQTGDKSSLYVDLYGGVSKDKSFLGFQYTGIETLTDFEGARDILSTLKDSGVQSVTAGYKNFSKAYFDGKLQTNLSPSDTMGGKSGMKSLIGYAKDNSVDLYFEADFYSLSSGGNGVSRYFDITKRLDLGAAEVYPKKINTNLADTTRDPYYMLKPSVFGDAVKRLLNSAEKLGVDGIYLENISNSLASDYDIGGVKRSDAAGLLAQALSTLSDKRLLLSSPNFYLWGNMSSAANLPISSSGHKLFDRDVPILQMLLKGSVPYSGYALNLSNTNDNAYLLHIAYAQNIHYAFISEDASRLQNTDLVGLYGLSSAKISEAADMAKDFEKLYSAVKGLYITDYILSENVSKTVYSDGTCVIVNYSDESAQVEGITVPPRGWSAVRLNSVICSGGEQ